MARHEQFLISALSKYTYADQTKREVLTVLSICTDLRPTIQKYGLYFMSHPHRLQVNIVLSVFNDGVCKDLLCLDGTIQVTYKGKTYNIPICMLLMDTHPYNCPLVYVKPTATMQIKPGRHVDHTGRVYLPYLHEWKHPQSDILGALEVLKIVFGEEPPVFAKPASSPAQPPYPMSGAPNPALLQRTAVSAKPAFTLPPPPQPFRFAQKPTLPVQLAGRNLISASEEEKEGVRKMMDISYTMVKEELPFSRFSSIVEMEKRHGVHLDTSHSSSSLARKFSMTLGEVLGSDLQETLSNVQYFTIICDGSTDGNVTERESVYIMFINKTSGKVETRLLSINCLEQADAETLHAVIVSVLIDVGIVDIRKKLVGFMSDRAAVNFGRKNGVATKLGETAPWLIAVHCLNHRLEFAIKNAFKQTYCETVTDVLMSLFCLYKKNPKRLSGLETFGSIMVGQVSDPARFQGSRWVQDTVGASNALISSYSTIVDQMENMAMADGTPEADKVKLNGYLTFLKSFKFLACLMHFADVLKPVLSLIEALQGDSTNLLLAKAAFESAQATLASVHYSNTLQEFLISASATSAAKFRGVTVTDVQEGLSFFKSQNHQLFLDTIQKELSLRLDDLFSHPILRSLKIVDVRLWPKAKEELVVFGTAEFKVVLSHFRCLLLENDVDLDRALTEWLDLKLFINDNLTHFPNEEIWTRLYCHFLERYRNALCTLGCLRVFPVWNPVVEGCFSTLQKVKCDWRNQLDEAEVESLLRIKTEGPPLGSPEAELLFVRATDQFFAENADRQG